MTDTQQSFPLNNDIQIPAVGFGTYLISGEDAPKAVRGAISNGYLHIDTAAAYRNEEAVGVGIRAGLEEAGIPRDAIFVTAKLWPGNPAWGDAPKTYQQTIAECEASLKKLGMDYVDLYLIHAPYGGSERIAQWRALLALKASGKARAIGVSNYTPTHLDEIKRAGLPMPDANQIELHPWSQKPDLLAYMADNEIAPIAYSSLVPLSTWRVQEGQDSAKTDAMRADGDNAASPFKAMAVKYDVSEPQLLLRWGVQSGFAVLPKSLNPGRMRQNIDLFSFSIDEADMTQIGTLDRGESVAWATGDPSIAD
jgi:2,5-diketo-D-gluconate reductase A